MPAGPGSIRQGEVSLLISASRTGITGSGRVRLTRARQDQRARGYHLGHGVPRAAGHGTGRQIRGSGWFPRQRLGRWARTGSADPGRLNPFWRTGTAERLFRDRGDAGRTLAGLLEHYRAQPDVVVLGLPRGGVPVAYEVARALGAPLDVFVVRKLGVPGQEEVAMARSPAAVWS
ncbi:MAG: hypothetical protein QOD82_1671 [Pseudonocardiales bacterium]|nr:hypothetical protein [Pseudonocardiales bacterium]